MGPVVGRILLRRPRALLLVILLAATATCGRSTRITDPNMAFLHLQRGREFRLATFRSGRRCYALSPLGHDPRAPLPVVLFLDGETIFRDDFHLSAELPGLWATGRMRPFLAVGIAADSVHRLSEYSPLSSTPYWNGREFMDGVVDTLLPALPGLLGTAIDTTDVTVAGFSLGGLMAGASVWSPHRCFVNAVALSPTYYWIVPPLPAWTEFYGPPHARRFFQATGDVHDNSIDAMDEALRAAGYVGGETLFSWVYHGCNHTAGCWSIEIVEGLRFTQPPEARRVKPATALIAPESADYSRRGMASGGR